LRFLYPQLLVRPESIELSRISRKRFISVSTNIVNNPPHHWFDFIQQRATTLQFVHVSFGSRPFEHPHYITTLFSGYSTIPCALASFSLGITCQACDSSITVLTASHSGSLSVEIVGRFNAGKTPSTRSRSFLRTFSMSPTRSFASIAPRSINARFSILRRLEESPQAVLFAIICVLLSSTVSTMRR